jgi:cytochrome c oxidase subunit 2
VDGSGGTGPTFKGIFGASHAMTDGTNVTVDENYLRESILEPQKKVRAGYEPVMPTYSGRLSDREITALVAYIESLAGE